VPLPVSPLALSEAMTALAEALGWDPTDLEPLPGLQKAVDAEFESLVRHLHKGRQISTWEPRHITPRALSLMSEDLARDVPLDVAVSHAKALMLPKAAPPPNPNWPGWQIDVHLAKVYAGQIKAAFAEAAREAAAVIAEAAQGRTRTTMPVLTDMIKAIFSRQLGRVLRNLWTEAWHLGTSSARGLTAGTATPNWGDWVPGDPEAARRYIDDPDSPNAGALRALLHAQGIDVIKSIAQTRMPDLEQAIGQAILHGDNADTLANRIEPILRVQQRAGMIATTETARAVSAATQDTYKQQGIDRVTWEIAPDERVCVVCAANHDAGPTGRDEPFPSGDLYPPAHPWCRCALVPASIEGVDIDELLGPLPAVIPDFSGKNWDTAWLDEARGPHGEWIHGLIDPNHVEHEKIGRNDITPGTVLRVRASAPGRYYPESPSGVKKTDHYLLVDGVTPPVTGVSPMKAHGRLEDGTDATVNVYGPVARVKRAGVAPPHQVRNTAELDKVGPLKTIINVTGKQVAGQQTVLRALGRVSEKNQKRLISTGALKTITINDKQTVTAEMHAAGMYGSVSRVVNDENAAGLYTPSRASLFIAGTGSGNASLAGHEIMHALDKSYGYPSRDPQWTALVRRMTAEQGKYVAGHYDPRREGMQVAASEQWAQIGGLITSRRPLNLTNAAYGPPLSDALAKEVRAYFAKFDVPAGSGA
jgi:SPP1 gp7 family putative phage head morphogenesis protein